MSKLSENGVPESAVAAIESATKAILEARQSRSDAVRSAGFASITEVDYPVADLLGRCFLRVCFWADVFSSWARRNRAIGPLHSAQPALRAATAATSATAAGRGNLVASSTTAASPGNFATPPVN